MKRILARVERVSKQLEQSALCGWLREDDDAEDKLKFVPSMLFFVLGFKDILESMSVSEPGTYLELEVNTHCLEDMDHWKWYLEDLGRLGFSEKSWGPSSFSIIENIWSSKSFVVRDLVYTTIYHVKRHNNPLISLVTIEMLEAAFGVFIDSMKDQLQHSGLYNRLQYFGKLHVDKELAHSRGAWVNGERIFPNENFKKSELDNVTCALLEDVVDDIAGKMLDVFNYWFHSRHDFVRYQPKKNNLVSPVQ
ncbi:MAG: hypothetical protein OEZ68_20055 [Gammaproteobacteria bacterium]|nr:hypothetical protein [Gammaproteobacteria bacterium]MDH5803103.1 hypothetical protein [Gammaproteobacteria bacterium]